MKTIATFDIALDHPQPTALYTIAQPSVGEYKHQTFERYSHVQLRLEATEGLAHYQIDWATSICEPAEASALIKGIPEEYSSYICLGIQQLAQQWQQLRYPMINVRITIIGGSYHLVNSAGFTYQRAAALALIRAVERGGLRRLL